MELTCQHDHGKPGHRGERDYESPSESRKIHDDVGYLTEKKGKRKVQELHGDTLLADWIPTYTDIRNRSRSHKAFAAPPYAYIF